MATLIKPIIPGSQLTATAATYYTCPANTRCIIKKLVFCNGVTAAQTVTVYRVPFGGSAGATNLVVLTRTLAPSETWECFPMEGHFLDPGDFIQALADTASRVTITGSGIEIT
jgi:hypothetical protein